MHRPRTLMVCLVAAIAMGASVVIAADPAATAPATATAPSMSPEAKAVVDEVGRRYDQIQSVQMDGTMSAEFDVSGQKKNERGTFTSAFQAPNKFRHDMKDNIIVGSTGEKAYAYLAARKSYTMKDVPTEPTSIGSYGHPIRPILLGQNPALTLAIATDAAGELTKNATVEKVADTTIDQTAYQTLQIKYAGAEDVMTLLIDPTTHLVRQVLVDLKPMLEKQNVRDVKRALVTIDYTRVDARAALTGDAFAWAVPEGAKEAKSAPTSPADIGAKAKALLGQPAPDFKLPGLDGKDVKLADLKGKVVVLDFWATWCPPCVASLPHLDKIYQKYKGDGVQVFAIDLGEEKDVVEAFVNERKLSVPVLLDAQEKTAADYGFEAPPTTFVIGKDGIIRNVHIGMFPPPELDRQIAEALKAE